MTQIQGGIKDEARASHEELCNSPDLKKSGRRSAPICAVTKNTENSPNTFIHFVKSPDGLIVPDFKKKLTSDVSFYLEPNANTLKQAFEQDLFEKSYESYEALTTHLLSILEHHYYQHISLTRRSGEVVFGLEKNKDLITREKATFVIVASGNHLNSTIKSIGTDNYIHFGDAEKYGQIFGRERVVYITFTQNHFVEDIKKIINRMECLRIPTNHAISQEVTRKK